MMAGKNAIALLVLLLVSSAWASSISRTFTCAYGSIANAYVTTDLAVTPSMSASGTYCVGDTFTPTIAVSSEWYSSTYDAGLASNANVGTCLIAATDTNLHQPLTWISASKYDALNSQLYFNTVTDFNNYVSSQGITPLAALEKSKYLKPDGTPFTVGGNQLFKAGIALYSKGAARITSSNPSYNRGPVEYTGASSVSFSPIQFTAPGTVTFTPQLDMTGAAASGRTYLNTCTENVLMYHNNGAGTFTASGSTVNVVVENPFICAISATNGQYSPPNPTPGSTVSFSFDLNNPGNRPLTINSGQITLAGGVFQSLVINNGYPITVPAGGSTHITGTVVVAPGTPAGTYPLNLNIYSQTLSADCTGSVKNCSAAPALIVYINVTPPAALKPDYVPVLSGQTAIVGQPFVATIITRNQGAEACGNVSQTDSSFNGSQFASFTVQPLGIGAQQSDTHTFTCPTTPGNYTLAANVDSTNQCAESNEANNYAEVLINCITAPPPTGAVNCTLSSNHGVDYFPNDQGVFTATCTNFTGQAAACPSFGWSSNRGSMNPTSTPPSAQPQSTFTAGSSQGAGTVIASSANFSCSSPVNIVSNPYGNMNLTCDFENHPAPAVFFPGETDNARAFCQNSPDCPPLTWSNNLAGTTLQFANTPQGASPILNLFSVSPAAPAPQSGGVTVRCTNPSQCNATCTASLNISQIPNRLDCSLVNHSTGGLFTINDWSWVRGRCSIDGIAITACPRLTWSSPRSFPAPGTITGSKFSPNPTLQSVDPLTNFSITNGVKGERGYIDAVSASPIAPGLRCNATIGVNVTDIGPDYQIVVLTVSNPIPRLHEKVRLTIWTQNTGNQNATGSSITQTVVAPEDCVPDRYSVPGLRIGEIDKHAAYTYTCPCLTPGRHIVTATANADRNIFETNYDNNARSTVFYCATNYTLTCSDYV